MALPPDNRALVIDDDDLVRMTVVIMMRRLGYEVLEASTGASGLQIFRDNLPRLVITDVTMPDIDGIEVVATMKALQPDTRVVVMSGGGQRGNVDHLTLARQIGADAVLPKPFESDELAIAIGDAAIEKN